MTDNKDYFMELVKNDPEKAYELYARTRDDRDGLSNALNEERRQHWMLVRNIVFAKNAEFDIGELINALLNNQKEVKE